jgi:hypothetical protein
LADKRDSKLKSIFLFQDAPALVVAQYGVNRNPSSAFVKGKKLFSAHSPITGITNKEEDHFLKASCARSICPYHIPLNAPINIECAKKISDMFIARSKLFYYIIPWG